MASDRGHRSGKQRPGGRTARNTQAVRKATVALLVERGLEGFSVREIAVRAGVDQSTIHRRWGSRQNVLLDALLSAVDAAVPVPDTGTLDGDMTSLLEELVSFYGTPLGTVIGRLSLAPLTDPVAENVRLHMWHERIASVTPIFTRAVERHELPSTVDATAATELLLAPLHLRLLTLARPPQDCNINAIAANVRAGLLANH